MKSRFLSPLLATVICPLFSNAQCHHGGGHGGYHGGGHIHAHGYSSHRHGAPDDIRDQRKGIAEVSGGTGVGSAQEMRDQSIKSATPVYTAAFRYFISDEVALGISAGAQMLYGHDTCQCMPGSTEQLPYNFGIRSQAISANLVWVGRTGSWYQWYFSVDMGVRILNEHDRYANNTASDATMYKFTGQYSIGCRMGHALGGFIEFGSGYKGMISTGLSYYAGWDKAHGKYHFR